jgi:hypothetical protein
MPTSCRSFCFFVHDLPAGVSASRKAPGYSGAFSAHKRHLGALRLADMGLPMADEKGRWFKCYASLQDSDVWDDLQALRCWLWCLQNVNWKDQKTFGKTFPRGSFWCNVRDGAKACRCSTNSWTSAMRKLVELGMITMVASPKYTTIKVINWGKFQGDSEHSSVSKIETQTETQTETLVETPTETRSRSIRQMKTELEGEGAAVAALPAPVDPPKPVEPKTRKAFVPPTMDEAKAYAKESIPIAFSVSQWWDYYASKGWRVGSHVMVDWKAAMRRWAREEAKRQPKSGYDRPSTMPSVIPGLEWMTERKKEPNQ